MISLYKAVRLGLAASKWRKLQKVSQDYLRIQFAKSSLGILKTTRGVLLGFFLAGLSYLLFLGGIVVFHLGCYFAVQYSPAWKIAVAFLLALLDFSLAGAVFNFLFSPKRWVGFAKVDRVLRNGGLEDESSQ